MITLDQVLGAAGGVSMIGLGVGLAVAGEPRWSGRH